MMQTLTRIRTCSPPNRSTARRELASSRTFSSFQSSDGSQAPLPPVLGVGARKGTEALRVRGAAGARACEGSRLPVQQQRPALVPAGVRGAARVRGAAARVREGSGSVCAWGAGPCVEMAGACLCVGGRVRVWSVCRRSFLRSLYTRKILLFLQILVFLHRLSLSYLYLPLPLPPLPPPPSLPRPPWPAAAEGGPAPLRLLPRRPDPRRPPAPRHPALRRAAPRPSVARRRPGPERLGPSRAGPGCE